MIENVGKPMSRASVATAAQVLTAAKGFEVFNGITVLRLVGVFLLNPLGARNTASCAGFGKLP